MRSPADYRVRTFASPGDLLQRVDSFLHRAEAENNLPLGLCRDAVVHGGEEHPAALWLAIEHAAEVVGVAVQQPPHVLVISRAPPAALVALSDHLHHNGRALPGVSGPVPSAAEFASEWCARSGQRAAVDFNQRIYACERVQSPAAVPGQLRLAEPSEQDLLVAWLRAFRVDVRMTHEPDRSEEHVARRIERRTLFVWDRGGPVSCAGVARETTHGITVNYVYTPPEHRGRGYASACVAAVTQRQLDAGKRFCCLYTDLANPTSNHIYQQLGYRPVCDAQMWRFHAA